MTNRIVHFEIPAENVGKLKKFYSETFGWKFEQWMPGSKEEYWGIITGKKGTLGINGGMMKRKNKEQPIVNTIDVKNIDKSIEKIKSMGGKIVVPKMAIPKVGWLAYFKDPEKNIFGLMEEDKKAM